jgi:heme/copper-type cytochrome/quinol oxidase subunit 2
LLHFVLVLVYFGLAIYAATDSVVVLAAEADVPWVWWATLFPLAISQATSGFLAFWKDAPSHHEPLIWGTLSGMTTVLAVVSVAGLVGLALVVKRSRKRHDSDPGTPQTSDVVILAAREC